MLDESGTGTNWDIYGRLVPWNGPSPAWPEFSVNTWTSNQWSPKVEYAGTQQEFMVIWNNQASGVPWYLSAQRVDAATGILVSSPFTVASGSEDRINHDLPYNQARNEFLVVYQLMSTSADIYAMRMTASGVILGGGEFAVAAWPNEEVRPAVSASRVANTHVVAWHHVVSRTDEDIYVRMVNGDGSLAGPPLQVVATSLTDSNPDVACHPGGTTCLVAWEQHYSSASGPVGISARTVDVVGTLGSFFDPRPIFIGETIECATPAIAGGRDGWLMVWEHDPDPTTADNQEIHGRAAFQLFADGFESGGLFRWSAWLP